MNHRSKYVFFILGLFGGVIFICLLVVIYIMSKMPSNGSWKVNGYEKLDQYQKADVGMMHGTYRIGTILWGGLTETEMKTTDLDEIDKWDAKITEENEIIDFKDFQNIYFNGNVYEAIKICRCNQMRYQELGIHPKDIYKLGRKDTVEIRFEGKEADTDYFIIIMSANGDIFIVPPPDMRTEENGYTYWMAYPVFSDNEMEE